MIVLNLLQPFAFCLRPSRRRVAGCSHDDVHLIRSVGVWLAFLLIPFVDDRRIWAFARRADREDIDISSDSPTGDTDSDYSAYFDIDIEKVADTGMFQRYGDSVEGPHPAHGPQTSEPENCTNFGIETTHTVWNCFAHDSGGRAIKLAVVLCPQTDLMCKDLPQKAAKKGYLRKQEPLELARAAIWLRENSVVDEDADPPVAVLAAVADQADLHTGRSDGVGAHVKIARTIFDNLETGDI